MVKHTHTIRRQFCRQIIWVCLAILWDWRLKGEDKQHPANIYKVNNRNTRKISGICSKLKLFLAFLLLT